MPGTRSRLGGWGATGSGQYSTRRRFPGLYVAPKARKKWNLSMVASPRCRFRFARQDHCRAAANGSANFRMRRPGANPCPSVGGVDIKHFIGRVGAAATAMGPQSDYRFATTDPVDHGGEGMLVTVGECRLAVWPSRSTGRYSSTDAELVGVGFTWSRKTPPVAATRRYQFEVC